MNENNYLKTVHRATKFRYIPLFKGTLLNILSKTKNGVFIIFKKIFWKLIDKLNFKLFTFQVNKRLFFKKVQTCQNFTNICKQTNLTRLYKSIQHVTKLYNTLQNLKIIKN